MKAFGYQVAVEYAKGDIAKGVWNLSKTSEGNLYPSKAREFNSSLHADSANREVWSYVGFRLFYGQLPNGNVVEFIKKGRIGQRDMAAIRNAGITRLWSSTFTSPMWLIDGVERKTTKEIDLSPIETTKEAIKWGKALGYFNPRRHR